MKYQTFEEYLQVQHAGSYHGVDDDMPDAFDNWLGELDPSEYVDFAEDYGKKMYLAGKEDFKNDSIK